MEGTRITKQATHVEVREVRRDSSTEWIAVYAYQLQPGLVGTDVTGLGMVTESDGATAFMDVRKIVLKLDIRP